MAYYGQQPMMGGGMNTATISGPDMNHDGIPDQLQGGMGMGGMQQPMGMGMGMQQPMMQQPMMGRPAGMTDYNHNGIPDRQEGGIVGMMGRFLPDNNGNGIPDILEGGRRRF